MVGPVCHRAFSRRLVEPCRTAADVGAADACVTLLEKDIGERRPEYADYIRRTNAFFPGPARR
jgi:hypothetical protein